MDTQPILSQQNLTQYSRRQIEKAIAECDRYIAKEGPRAADLRPEWAAKALAHAIAHRANLLAMVAA